MKPIRALHLEVYARKKNFLYTLVYWKKKLCFFPLFLHKNKTQTSSFFQRLLKELFYTKILIILYKKIHAKRKKNVFYLEF